MKAGLPFRTRAALGFIILALNVAVGVLVLREPTLKVPIQTGSINTESGHNFIAAVPIVPPFPYVFGFASPSDPEGSLATVIEDGKPLGPSHALHSDIRTEGAGRFSFWSGAVYFSTSDNSDPRTNGRAYGVVARARLPHRVTLGLAGLDLLCLAVFWKTVLRWLARRWPVIAAAGAALLAARILLAAVGRMPPMFDGIASAINGAMAGSITIHLLFGVGLCCAVYATGLGTILWVERRPRVLADLLLRAFLPGTLVLAVAALLAVAAPGGAMLAAAACVIAAVPLTRYRPAPGELRRALAPALFCAPAVGLYATVLSFRFHGTSATLAGAPYGDEAIYAGWANDLVRHVAPVFNLAIEGFTTPYGNLMPSLLAAPLLGAGWFDPYLFFSASLPVLSLLALGLTAPLLVRECGDERREIGGLLAFAGLAAASFRYPSVLVESPTFAFLLPIVVSTLYLAAPNRAGPTRSWQAIIVATVGTAVSKVVALPVLALVPAPEVIFQVVRRASRRQVAVAVAFSTIVLVYVAIALRTYLPLFVRLGGLGPPSWEVIVRYRVVDPLSIACVVARDLGAVLLAVAWAGSRATGLKLGVWVGIGLGFLMPFLFHTSLSTAMLVTALVAVAGSGVGARARPWLLSAAALMLPQAVFAEGGGPAVTLAWIAVVACLTAAISNPVAPGARQTRDGRATRMRYRAAAAATALFSGVVLWGAGAGEIRVGPEALTVTSNMRDIWLAVRRNTPPDALVFTDQTGDTESRLGGWNDFALAAQRQFYIVSWSIALRSDPETRHARLDKNTRVLSGALNPAALRLSRSYNGYFAVVDAKTAVPPWFTPICGNSSFALYRILPHRAEGGTNDGRR